MNILFHIAALIAKFRARESFHSIYYYTRRNSRVYHKTLYIHNKKKKVLISAVTYKKQGIYNLYIGFANFYLPNE